MRLWFRPDRRRISAQTEHKYITVSGAGALGGRLDEPDHGVERTGPIIREGSYAVGQTICATYRMAIAVCQGGVALRVYDPFEISTQFEPRWC